MINDGKGCNESSAQNGHRRRHSAIAPGPRAGRGGGGGGGGGGFFFFFWGGGGRHAATTDRHGLQTSRQFQGGVKNSSGCTTICERGPLPQPGEVPAGHAHLSAGGRSATRSCAFLPGGEGTRPGVPFRIATRPNGWTEALTPLPKLRYVVLTLSPADDLATPPPPPPQKRRQPVFTEQWRRYGAAIPRSRSRCSPLISGAAIAAKRKLWRPSNSAWAVVLGGQKPVCFNPQHRDGAADCRGSAPLVAPTPFPWIAGGLAGKLAPAIPTKSALGCWRLAKTLRGGDGGPGRFSGAWVRERVTIGQLPAAFPGAFTCQLDRYWRTRGIYEAWRELGQGLGFNQVAARTTGCAQLPRGEN